MAHYKLEPWLQYRNNIHDFLNLMPDRNMAHAHFEVDITKMAGLIAERKLRVHSTLSHLAYLLWCYAQAVKQHPNMQAIPYKKQCYLFEDVDISMIFEKTTPQGQKVPAPYIFRAAQNKSFEELLTELVAANDRPFDEFGIKKRSVFYQRLPAFMRRFLLRRAVRHPLRWKEALGTVAFTTLGMSIRNRKFWPVPIGPYACMLAAGSEFSFPDNRRGWCLCLNLDHALNDGAPAVRFGRTFIQLVESAEGLLSHDAR
jgi:pyruvate/2-oxoglutarate dehydrogenase complex dihydrolipoamide acyltransferase (E2) component